MGGGLMQLVAYGAQDIYLTGNPQITFFKVVYRRHTNFSMESIQQTLNGTTTVGTAGATATCTISRNGDLVHKVYVVATCTDKLTDGHTDTMHNLVQESEIEIGGQTIDKQTKEWRNVWNELSTPESKAMGLKCMQGCLGTMTPSGNGVKQVHIPLLFWFCRNPGLALPLIALQYHEVKIKFTWGVTGGTESPIVYCDYIYLDTDERRRFAQVSHEYLIEQVQESSMTNKMTHDLHFNHPVKELIWTTADSNYDSALLKLNGHDRFSVRENEYFQLQQPFDYHTAVPKQNLPPVVREAVPDETPHHMERLSSPLHDLTSAISSATMAANTIHVEPGGTKLQLPAAQMKHIKVVNTTLVLVLHVSGAGDSLVDLFAAPLGTAYYATVGSVGKGTAADPVVLSSPFNAFGLFPVTGITAGAGASSFQLYKLQDDHSQARTSKLDKLINVYSFALKPEEHQPSGTCNFSRIDNAQLIFTGLPGEGGTIYAVNYNVLRIMSGMGGLAYSN